MDQSNLTNNLVVTYRSQKAQLSSFKFCTGESESEREPEGQRDSDRETQTQTRRDKDRETECT